MTTAVVLSAYNGEKYIKEQLLSLVNQSRKPDRVYIGDDGSSDDTVNIIKAIIRDNHFDNWVLIINGKNKGWKRNFHDLIQIAQEDIIFLCDQDDVWYPDKISIMSEIMENHENINLLACGYEPKYEDDTEKITKVITTKMLNNGTIEKIIPSSTFIHVIRPGCTYAVKRTFCTKIDRFWNTEIPHDAMLWRTSIIDGTAYILNKNLMSWRRYNSSASNRNREKHKYRSKYELIYESYLTNTTSHLLYLSCLYDLINNGMINPNRDTMNIIMGVVYFEQQYKANLEGKNPFKMLLTSLKYKKYFLTIKSLFAGAFILYNIKH